MISVVLVGSENPSNLGFIARTMKNFGVKSLVLVDPKIDHLSREALTTAKHASEILKKARVEKLSYLYRKSRKNIFLDNELAAATTSVAGSSYNILRLPVPPRDLAARMPKGKRCAILFGRDGAGLTNEEIRECDLTVMIPSSKEYPALNISHAVAIVLYELFLAQGRNKITDHVAPATRKEREVIRSMFHSVLENLDFSTEERRTTQMEVWERIMGKAILTSREAFAVLGFLRKIDRRQFRKR